jgi:hypothetical protein
MHDMDHVGIRDGLDVWVCPECGRTIGLGRGTLKVLWQGDFTVGHQGATGGIRMGPVEVREDPWTDDDVTDLAQMGIALPIGGVDK